MKILPQKPKAIVLKYKNRKIFFFLEVIAILLCALLGYFLSFFNISKEFSLEIIILITPLTIIFMEYLYRKLS